MTRSLKVYQGEDETPEVDLTEPSSNVHVIWEEVEAGGRAFKGESSISTFPMRDERAETGNPANLPSGLTHISLSAGSRLEWLVNGTRLFRGRVGPKDYTRGRQKADRAREVVVSAQDTNYDLRNIIVDGWDRPEETDIARVSALVSEFLQTDPRASTNISTAYVSSSNTVTLGPRVYDATSPAEVLADVALVANKLHFVTIDDELFYDGADSTAYRAGLRISDRLSEINSDQVLPCAPTTPTVWYTYGALGITEHQFTIDDDLVDAAIYVFISDRSDAAAITAVTWDPTGANEAFTKIGEADGGNLSHLEVWRLLSPTPGIGSKVVLTGGQDHGIGVVVLTGVNQSDPDDGFTSANGTGSTTSLTISASGDQLPLDAVDTWDNDVLLTDGPTPSGTEAWSTFGYTSNPGTRDIQFGGSYGDATPSWTLAATQTWVAIGLAVNASGGSGGGATIPTFPPIWDVGPASTEDGMQLLSGLRLYYGQGSNTYVYVNDPTTANEYWHSEQSLYTSDPAINTPTRATRLAESILQRRKFEERTVNVSIGPLNEDQVGCLKPGQLISIKARAITYADDQFVSLRIAQLRWTTPVPGTYFAHMQLDRPIKEAPYGVGPKTATDSINRHVEQGSNSHPEYVLRGTLTTQGDLPYRGASDWTRRAIGASNTVLTSTGIVPVWSTLPASGSGSHATDHEDGGSDELEITDLATAETDTDLVLAPDGAGGVEFRAESGGGGGVDWALDVNESGTTFTNFTASTGTWASSGTVITQTNAGGSHMRARYNTIIPIGFPLIAECELKVTSGGNNAGFVIGYDGGTGNGGLGVSIHDSGNYVQVEAGAIAIRGTLATTIATNTFYKVRAVISGGWCTIYIDGTLLGTIYIGDVAGTDPQSYVGLWTWSAAGEFRNFKVWTLSTGAPA